MAKDIQELLEQDEKILFELKQRRLIFFTEEIYITNQSIIRKISDGCTKIDFSDITKIEKYRNNLYIFYHDKQEILTIKQELQQYFLNIIYEYSNPPLEDTTIYLKKERKPKFTFIKQQKNNEEIWISFEINTTDFKYPKNPAKPIDIPEAKDFSGTPYCPNCGIVLAKLPQRKTKCKECGKFIYHKAFPLDTEKQIITEEQNQELEQARDNFYTSYNYLKKIAIFTATPIFEIFIKKYQAGEDYKAIMCFIFNMIRAEVFSSCKDFRIYSHILYQQALFEYETGGNFIPTLEGHHNYCLNSIRFQESKNLWLTIKEVMIVWNNIESEKVYSLKSQLDPETRILPHKNRECGEEFCKCLYIGHMK